MIAVLVTLLLLAGCQSVLNTARVTSEAVIIDDIIGSGAPLRIIKSANISEQEMEAINHALVQYKAFREKWWSVLKQPLQEGVTMIALRADYQNIVAQYHNVNAIVQSHLEDFDEVQIVMLQNYQVRAEALHREVMALIDVGERHSAIANAIDSVLIMLRIIR